MAFTLFEELEKIESDACNNLPIDNPTWQECIETVTAYESFCGNASLGYINAFVIEPLELMRVLGLDSKPSKGLKIYLGLNHQEIPSTVRTICVPVVQTNDGFEDVDVPKTVAEIAGFSKSAAEPRPCPPRCKKVSNILNVE